MMLLPELLFCFKKRLTVEEGFKLHSIRRSHIKERHPIAERRMASFHDAANR